jgi:hypothetical protein
MVVPPGVKLRLPCEPDGSAGEWVPLTVLQSACPVKVPSARNWIVYVDCLSGGTVPSKAGSLRAKALSFQVRLVRLGPGGGVGVEVGFAVTVAVAVAVAVAVTVAVGRGLGLGVEALDVGVAVTVAVTVGAAVVVGAGVVVGSTVESVLGDGPEGCTDV